MRDDRLSNVKTTNWDDTPPVLCLNRTNKTHRDLLVSTRQPARLTCQIQLLLGACRVHSGGMPRKRWNELSPLARRLIVAAGTAEGVFKIAALADLARRPTSQVRGSKTTWAAAIIVVNLAGAVPIGYFVKNIRR